MGRDGRWWWRTDSWVGKDDFIITISCTGAGHCIQDSRNQGHVFAANLQQLFKEVTFRIVL